MRLSIVLLTLSLLIIMIFIPYPAPARDAAQLADNLQERGLNPLLITGIISMIPIFELRGGIPIGIALFNLHPLAVFFVCVGFNLLPVIPILLLLSPLRRIFENIPPFKGLFNFLQRRAEKNRQLVEKYEELGLTIFVGIPLPVTGAWTGSIIAEILGLRIMKSFGYIALGVTLAGIIVTLLTILKLYGIIGGACILLTFIVIYIIKVRKELKSLEIENIAKAPGRDDSI
jgi:uncharacterized membrane protein